MLQDKGSTSKVVETDDGRISIHASIAHEKNENLQKRFEGLCPIVQGVVASFVGRRKYLVGRIRLQPTQIHVGGGSSAALGSIKHSLI